MCFVLACCVVQITLREDCTIDELIDVIESTDKIGMMRVYIPCVYVCNMIDKISIEELDLLDRYAVILNPFILVHAVFLIQKMHPTWVSQHLLGLPRRLSSHSVCGGKTLDALPLLALPWYCCSSDS